MTHTSILLYVYGKLNGNRLGQMVPEIWMGSQQFQVVCGTPVDAQ